jgi:hypothetical protein
MLKQIKRCILFTAFVLLCTSCKKGKTDNGPGTISVSIDGNHTTFNVGAKAIRTNVTGGYGIMIQGYKKDPSESQTNLSFVIASPNPIIVKTYTENAGGNPLVEMVFFQEFILGVGDTARSYGSATNPVTITITSINSSNIKGSFFGELLYTDLNNNTGKNVLSNGVFNLNF